MSTENVPERDITTQPAGGTVPTAQEWTWAEEHRAGTVPTQVPARDSRSARGVVARWLIHNASAAPVPRKDVLEALVPQLSRNTVDKWLKTLTDDGTITRTYQGRTMAVQWNASRFRAE